jgi:hypothetical protein
MQHAHICDVCREEDTNDQIKSGCGHLTYICDGCRDEQNAVAHDKCRTCKGQKTGDFLLREEEDYSNSYMSSLMRDLLDDELRFEEEPYIDAQETYEDRYGTLDDYL